MEGKTKTLSYSFLFSLVQTGQFELIQHYFPVRGHSFLLCDRDLLKTESKKRKTECVYVPEHWFDVMKSAKKRKLFSIVSVSRDMIYDYQTHLSLSLKKTMTHEGEKKREFVRERYLSIRRNIPPRYGLGTLCQLMYNGIVLHLKRKEAQ